MPTPSPRRSLLMWGLWFLLGVVVLLLPWRSPSGSGLGLTAPAAPPSPPWELWQSPFDRFPWFGAAVRAHWRSAWARVRQWGRHWQAWLTLAGRLWSCQTLARVIGVLTQRQVARYLGALPVLYPLLEQLRVRDIVNRYCPTDSPVDHGTIVVVLALNRLMAPRPLYQVMDWLAQTVLADHLGVAVAKFNDDRLGRSLDALAPHAQAIWQDIASQALLRYQIDLSVVFYDLTALVMSGDYPDSELVDYGFAHHTPSDKQKLKLGVTVAADGGVPCVFQPWLGRTADKATVEHNLTALHTFLTRQGINTQQVLVVGDSANLNAELAWAYEWHHLKYLASLPLVEKAHRTLVTTPPERRFYGHPLTDEHGPTGYWGLPCAVTFTPAGHNVVHRGLIVLSGPMRTAWRRQRATDCRALAAALRQVQAKIGTQRYRTAAEVLARAQTQCRHASVGKLFDVKTEAAPDGAVTVSWRIDRWALCNAMQADGRYLLVTNDPALTPARMLATYRDKDQVEKRFRVYKQDLRVRPLFVHSDERVRAMLLVNLIALLAYSLLERQARQQGVPLTARRIMEQLATLQLIEIEAVDGSWTRTVREVSPAQWDLLTRVWRGIGRPLALPPTTPKAVLAPAAPVSALTGSGLAPCAGLGAAVA